MQLSNKRVWVKQYTYVCVCVRWNKINKNIISSDIVDNEMEYKKCVFISVTVLWIVVIIAGFDEFFLFCLIFFCFTIQQGKQMACIFKWSWPHKRYKMGQNECDIGSSRTSSVRAMSHDFGRTIQHKNWEKKKQNQMLAA